MRVNKSKQALLAVAAICAVPMIVNGSQASAADIPKARLALDNPEISFQSAGTWTIPIHHATDRGPSDVGACRGTYLNPSIVAVGTATAVHYGVKFFCTEPVEYDILAGVYYKVHEGEEEDAGSTEGHGVSQQPFVEGHSFLCSNNNNGGWIPYDFSTVHGLKHSGQGNQVTVGCQFIG